jgi:hypothetical protein
MSHKKAIPGTNAATQSEPEVLLRELRELISTTRSQLAQTVNTALTTLYWHVGNRIRREILQEQRAEYGQQIVSAVGRQLETEFGRGFSAKSLRHMIRFAEAFPDWEIVSVLLRQLSWTHFLSIICLKDPLQRDFYAEMCRIERWSTRTLQERIQSMLFECRRSVPLFGKEGLGEILLDKSPSIPLFQRGK